MIITDNQGFTFVQRVAAARSELLATNLDYTCFEFTRLVLTELRSLDSNWGLLGKTSGEGQFTPPGFQPQMLMGADGKSYRITGVSHDALFNGAENRQVDVLGRGNDSPNPIFNNDGTRMTAVAQWGPIDPVWYRPNNPWVNPSILNDDGSNGTNPLPVITKPYPGDDFFRHSVGAALAADYAEASQTLNDGASVWFARTIWDYVNGNFTIEQSIVKHRREWREVLGLPPA